MAIDFTCGDTNLLPQHLSLERVKPTLAQYQNEVGIIKQQAEALVIKDEATLKEGIELGGRAKKIISWIEKKRKEFIEEPSTFVKEVNAFCKQFTEVLELSERLSKQKINQYQTRIELERREAEKKAQEAARKYQEEINKEAKKKGVEAPVVVTPIVPEEKKITRTESGISSYQVKRWVCTILNPAEVPHEYCQPVQRLLDDAVKMGVRSINGCRIEEISETRFR